MRRGLCFVAVCAPMLAGCISWSVDESWFFKPVSRAQKAATVGELKLDAEERLTLSSAFSADFSRIFPNFPDRMPARISHDFVALGGERIAITRVAGANGSDDEPLIVHCGGESGDRRSHGTVYAGKILPWGEALLMDYPGYGDSSGQPTVAAMLAFQRELAAYLDGLAVDRPLILWGHSLGGPICAAIASRSAQVDAVVLETTAPNFADVMDATKPWFTPPTLQLDVVEGLKAYDVAVALATFTHRAGRTGRAGGQQVQTTGVLLDDDLPGAHRLGREQVELLQPPIAVGQEVDGGRQAGHREAGVFKRVLHLGSPEMTKPASGGFWGE